MLGIAEKYRKELDVALRNFIPKELKPDDKKRIKESIKSIKLLYQIVGEEIPSVNDSEYHCEVIQIYDIKISDIKQANYLANIYQGLIKPFCIIRFYDYKEEVYSLAIKRLNQMDNNLIVIENAMLTEVYPLSFSNNLIEYINFSKLKNRTNKVTLYKELYIKIYILSNKEIYRKAKELIDSDIWYSREKIQNLFEDYKSLVGLYEKSKKSVTASEKVKINKEIRVLLQNLDKYLL